MELLEFLIKFFGILFMEIVEGFVRIFVPKKPKNIGGKLALVTGEWNLNFLNLQLKSLNLKFIKLS